MVLESKDFELFLSIIKDHHIRPLVREIDGIINGETVVLYEVIGLDNVTEYIIKKEMESKNGKQN